MSRFLEALHSGRVLLMDGAMGTELIRQGLNPEDEACERWNLVHPDKVAAVHRAYADAGATILVTNTFRAHAAFARHGVLDSPQRVSFNAARLEWKNECRAALEQARRGGGNVRLMLGSVGPLAPEETPGPSAWPGLWRSGLDRAALWCAAQIDLLAEGADAVLLETQSSLKLLSAVVEMRKFPRMRKEVSGGEAVSQKPLLVSLAYLWDGYRLRTKEGSSPEEVAKWASLERSHVAALGVNCGRNTGLGEVREILHRYREATHLPLFARPNAGTPTRTADGWSYPLTPENLAARLPELLQAGITLFGGCCGTTPAHIAACRPVIDEWNRRHAPGETRP